MKYTIITSTYNQLQYLPKMVESLVNQTFKDFEWIVCDDGSSDGTQRFVENLKTGFPIKYFRNRKSKKMRLSKIINKAIAAAEGEYCVFIMGDSFIELNFLEQMKEFANPDFIICGSRIEVDDGVAVDVDWRLKKELVPADARLIPVRPYDALTGNGLVIPRKAFEKHGGWDEDFTGYGGEDNELMARLYYSGDYVFWSVPQARVYHHWHYTKDTKNRDKLNAKIKEYADKK